ncbi:hypothetical protein TTHT_1675 [Thermotomaculum hydrothermale]|uniref:Zinc-finger domain-containing protein n=1 Tax=Thermotomaculum hydrothermale TaxID=981385 RepID=A0A7R6PG70_9BACT|nr:hypothetical protein [Thermotomaculum hydrothermale]BBB33153.1 hypothetical protein TTHT_1675 [Thermotomaculum hydrothermale]
MNCLNEQQLMELLYREGNPENLKNYKNHLLECKKCTKEFLELIEIRDYLKGIGEENVEPVVIVMNNKPKKDMFSRFALVAASLILAFSIIFTGYQTKKVENAQKAIAQASINLEKRIDEVSYKTEKTARDNYLLIMGLKNYIDSSLMNNQNTRRATYEKF